jgi:hypothetical protein
VNIGYEAGMNNSSGSYTVKIGYQAGKNDFNSNRLFIDNSATASPLIWGDFSTNELLINGDIFVTGNIYRQVDAGQPWHRLDDEDGNDNAYWFQSTDVPSDMRLKSDVTTLTNALGKLMDLRGVAYNWSEEGLSYFTSGIDGKFAGPEASDEEDVIYKSQIKTEAINRLSQRSLGLIAQEVKEVIPEVVHENEDGYLQIAYGNLAGLMIEAIKEQQDIIQDQNVENDRLKEELESLRSEMEMLKKMVLTIAEK